MLAIIISVVVVLILIVGIIIYMYYSSATTGQFVILARDNTTNILNIAEIEVYDTNGVKIAGVPSLSSTYGVGGTYPAGNLTDGVLTNFASTNSGAAEWMKIDLGADKAIGKIVIYNRKDCCQDRIIGTKLTIVNSAGTVVYTTQITTADQVFTFQM